MSEPKAHYHVDAVDPVPVDRLFNAGHYLVQSTDYHPPAPLLVSALIRHSCLSTIAFADRLHVSPTTLRRWCLPVDDIDHRVIPYTAWVVCLQLEGYLSSMPHTHR